MSICIGEKSGDGSGAGMLGVLPGDASEGCWKLNSSFLPMLALEILGTFVCLAGTFSFSLLLLLVLLSAPEEGLLLDGCRCAAELHGTIFAGGAVCAFKAEGTSIAGAGLSWGASSKMPA